MSGGQDLASSEKQTFDQMSKAYDRQEYTKAIKLADQILGVKPENGETLCMKAISIHAMLDGKTGRKDHAGHSVEEAYQLAKLGLRYNMGSALCWHSLAMLHRSDHQYGEALKCYKQAATRDKESVSILRDMSSVAAQLRDWDTFLDCRQKLLALKQPVRAHWLGVALGHYLVKNYDHALAIVNVMCTIMDPGETLVEKQEVALFRANTALAAGRAEEAVTILEDNDKLLTDVVTKLGLKAKALAAAGKKQDAEQCYMTLIKDGKEEGESLFAIAELRGIQLDHRHQPRPEGRAAFTELLNSVIAVAPKCDFARRLVLDVCPIATFEPALVAYVAPFIRKNIPSLFSVLRSLYYLGDAERVATVERVFLRFAEEIAAGKCSQIGDINPTHVLWVWTFLATHYSHIGKHAEGLEYIEKAIKHSPTVEMLYLHRAKILRRQGKIEQAAEDADLARRLDLQDRYLNTKAAKYMLRAGKIDEAEATLALFIKASEVNDHYLQFFESQTLWYERELGQAFFEKGDVYQALQCFLLYEQHRRDDHRSVMDFHQYCIRNCRCLPWLELVAREVVHPSEKFFLLLCPRIVRCYLKVHQMGAEKVLQAHVPRPELPPSKDPEENAQRAQRRKEFLTEVDLTNPLDKAQKYVEALQSFRPYWPLTHEVAFEYHRAKGQPLGCAKALRELRNLQAASLSAFEGQWLEWSAVDGLKWPEAVRLALDAEGARSSAK